MHPILEFADAKSLGAVAVIAGSICYVVFRILIASKVGYVDKLAKFSAHCDALNAEIARLRRSHEEQESKAIYYESEFNKLFATYRILIGDADEKAHGKVDKTHLEKISSHAEFNPTRSGNIEREQKVGGQKSKLSGLEKELGTADSEITDCRPHDARQEPNTDEADSEPSRLNAAHGLKQNITAQDPLLRSEATPLAIEISSAAIEMRAQAQANEQLKSEVARLSATLFSAYADLRNTVREQEIAKRDLRQTKVALQDATASMLEQVQQNEKLNTELARLSTALFSAYADLRNTLREQEITKRDLRHLKAALQNSTTLQ